MAKTKKKTHLLKNNEAVAHNVAVRKAVFWGKKAGA